MIKDIPKEVLEAFTTYETSIPDHAAGEITIKAVNGGLINHSYKVSCQLKPDFLLQRINKFVFADPEQVQQNYICIWQYAEFEFTGLRLPSPIQCGKTTTLFLDSNNNYWRAFEFIDDTRMLTVAEKPAQAKATAKAFAQFTTAFSEFNVDQLKVVIPGFHDLSLRFSQFEESLKGENYERMAKALPIVDALKKREKYKHFYEIIIESDQFPLRVMHLDAKIANVLFNDKTGKVVCLVDFDTVMPGYFFSDLGDMIRSMVCKEDENSSNYNSISIRKEFYDAIVSGYMDVMGKELTESEIKYIHYSGLLMIYMQALRFITDYLNGDVYYKTTYEEQNFDRGKNQFTLLHSLEEFLSSEYQFRV